MANNRFVFQETERDMMDPVVFDRELRTNASFYFGNIFARVWWEDLKSSQGPPESASLHVFNDLIDEALAGSDASANREFVERLQRQVGEWASAEKE